MCVLDSTAKGLEQEKKQGQVGTRLQQATGRRRGMEHGASLFRISDLKIRDLQLRFSPAFRNAKLPPPALGVIRHVLCAMRRRIPVLDRGTP
jgi:hypothetical protein